MIERHRDPLVSLRAQAGTTFVSQGRTVFAASEDGFVERDDVHGLFAHETRVVCRYRYLIDGVVPQPVALSNVAQHSWLGYYITLPPGVDPGPPDMGSGQVQPEFVNTLEMRLSRYVGDGMHEDVDLANFSDITTTFRLDLEIDADFADRVELRSGRKQDGPVARHWQQTGDGTWELAFDYRVQHAYDHQGDRGTARIHRGLRLQVSNADTPPSYADGRLSWEVELEPRASWHACIDLAPMIDGIVLSPLYGCHSLVGVHNDRDRERELFLHEATDFATSESMTFAPIVVAALEQAKHDLAALRLYDLDHGERAWTLAAGLPMYTALYGRDTLAAAWQAALASPAMLRGTLPELVRWQGTKVDDWRDEQPGRMLHEAHTGPLATLRYTPQGRYYGSITTSSFYTVALAELWHWTGDIEAVRPLIEPAMKALHWLEQWCDPNGDGLYEYQTRSEQGTVHQGWKDSSDAIVDEHGTIVAPPIATCEEQGFVYQSKLYLAEILGWLDGKDESERLRREASELRKRFNEAFWMEDQGFFALGLDSQGRHIRSISSNPGPCIGTGIVDDALVEQVANRLMAPDLFTGWGIRTLSSEHPAFNPFSYHRGSVWPVEHGTIAQGFGRYSLHEHLHTLTRAQFEASARFSHHRLPEVFSGHQRDDDHPFPALYPQTNSPQAWSASAIVRMVQSLLGIFAYAPLDLLLLDPHLPAWLPDLTLRNLHVGKATLSLRFRRGEDGTTEYEILDQDGPLYVVRQPCLWTEVLSPERCMVDTLRDLVPHT